MIDLYHRPRSIGPYVICPECMAKHPSQEEKSCSHGCFNATCAQCGRVRVGDEKPYWHCLGPDLGNPPRL